MNVVLYSAIYGGYDLPKALPEGLDCQAVMYTDWAATYDLARAAGWEPRLVGEPRPEGERQGAQSMLRHKWWKTHPLEAAPDADVSLWVDGSMTITVPDYADRCLDALGADDWSAMRHPWRSCVFDEAAYSTTLPRYANAGLLEQAEFYRSIGHPADWGLIATGANVRRHTATVERVSDQWWWECRTRSHQDQVSLPVLFRLAEDLRWNDRLPWWAWWHLGEHLPWTGDFAKA